MNKPPFHKRPWIWITAVFVAVVLVIIPFAINYAYMEGLNLNGANTAFSASDWLSFYGTILGAITTIVALIATIRFTAHQSIQEQRNQKNALIAEYKKVERIRSHDEMKQYALKIKDLYLLEILDDGTTSLEDLLKQSKITLFCKDYGELPYWISKLDLSDNAIENDFRQLIYDFMDNTRCIFADASKKDEAIQKYKEEYEEKKQAYIERKKKHIEREKEMRRDNPLYGIQIGPRKNESQPSTPPYGEFTMEAPKNKLIVLVEASKKLKEFRDEHKNSFIITFEKLIKYKQTILNNEISMLFDFDKK